MTDLEIAGQIISIAAMACNILSFQLKKQKYLITLQLFGAALFSASYFLLGAVVGGLLNIVGVIRAVVFLFPKKLNSSHPAWLVGFVGVYLTFYVLTFTVFGVEPSFANFAVELLPIIGMTISNIGFMLANSRAVRRLGLIASPMWLTYNIYYVSVGAIICEVVSLVSIIIGIFRHDRRKKGENAAQA
jgi:hypothetical protein